MANIVLTGFMGTGKSTVGRRLARALGQGFLDLDELIEKEAGAPVKEIFSRHGEARFRQMEKEAVAKLASGGFGSGLVVSTGGGIVLDPENREALKSWGVLVCLTASVDEVLRRVGRKDDRPLLKATDVRSRIESLLKEREDAYGDCHLTVDTTDMSVEEVVERIKEFVEAAGGRGDG